MTDRVAVEGGEERRGEERKGKTEERTEENSDSERGTKRRVGGRKADWIEEAGNTTDGQIRKEDDGKQGFVQSFAKLLGRGGLLSVTVINFPNIKRTKDILLLSTPLLETRNLDSVSHRKFETVTFEENSTIRNESRN